MVSKSTKSAHPHFIPSLKQMTDDVLRTL